MVRNLPPVLFAFCRGKERLFRKKSEEFYYRKAIALANTGNPSTERPFFLTRGHLHHAKNLCDENEVQQAVLAVESGIRALGEIAPVSGSCIRDFEHIKMLTDDENKVHELTKLIDELEDRL